MSATSVCSIKKPTSSPFVKRSFLQKAPTLVKARLLAQQVYDEPVLEIDDIQGDPLVGFKKPHQAILAIDIVDDTNIANTKQWLTDYVIPQVTSAKDVTLFRNLFSFNRKYRGGVKPTSMTHTCTNVSFSYNALLKLAPKKDVEQFYRPGVNVAFKVGLKLRSTYLQDPSTGIGAAQNWVVGSDRNPDILIQIASDRASMIQEEIDNLKAGFEVTGNPVVIKHTQFGKQRPDSPGSEHFGFLDGISNPGMRGKYALEADDKAIYLPITPRHLDNDDSRNDMYGLPGQNLLWPGEVILGLPQQYADTTSGDVNIMNQPGSSDFIGPPWARNGTYLVYRRLKQDVVKFWTFLKDSAADIATHPDMEGFSAEQLGAKVVGRWKSGTPIVRTPDEDNIDLGSDKRANNSFQYVSEMEPFLLKPRGKTDGYPQMIADPGGISCPLASHLRKVQPRDHSTDIGNSFDSLKRRLIRRGINYGDPIADVTVDDGADRGLLFVSYQASIDEQFEFLITHWANSDTDPHNGGGHDMVIGQSDAKDRNRTFDVPLPDGTTKQLNTTDEWVIPTGGGYFFMPSISALKNVIAKV